MLAIRCKASITHAPKTTVADKWSRNHLLRYALVVVGCCLGAAPARAEMLLAEISYTTPQPVVAPATFNFGVGNSRIGTDPFHVWTEMVPTLPYSSTADAATVTAFDRLLTTAPGENSVDFGLVNGPYEQPPATFPPMIRILDLAFAGQYTHVGLTATRYAPPIRVPYALAYYALTAIERNVTATTQTIRIYGFADPPPDIPEPSTWLLVMCVVLLHVSGSFPCLRCGLVR